MIKTTHSKLIAKKSGIYTVFVFQEDDGNLIMCTKLPNWGPINIGIGDSGFLTYDTIIAGEKYYDRKTGKETIYKFSNIYFQDFLKDDVKTKVIL